MKIALCLSGHLRKFEQTAKSLHHIIQNHECDIFIHTWDRMGYNSAYKSDSTVDFTKNYLSKIKSLYNPKKMIIEDSSFIEELKRQGDQYAPHLIGVPKHVGHMASMFYKIYAVDELRKLHEKETGTQYDWVIRCRPDLMFHGKTDLPPTKTENVTYIPKHLSGHNWICDQFAIALPNEMELYSSFFFHMQEYFSARNEYYPEKFMDWSMKKKNLTPIMWESHFSILR